MTDPNEHVRYYVLFENHTQGMILHDILDRSDIPNRIAPAPRDTDGKAACGMALLIHPDDVERAKACMEENHADYVAIVPLANQLRKNRDRYC